MYLKQCAGHGSVTLITESQQGYTVTVSPASPPPRQKEKKIPFEAALHSNQRSLTTSGVFPTGVLPVFSSVSIGSLKWGKPTINISMHQQFSYRVDFNYTKIILQEIIFTLWVLLRKKILISLRWRKQILNFPQINSLKQTNKSKLANFVNNKYIKNGRLKSMLSTPKKVQWRWTSSS